MHQPTPLTEEHPHPPQRAPIHPNTIVQAGIILGLGMIGLALLWVNIVRQGDLWAALPLVTVWQLLPGLLVGALIALATWYAGRHIAGMQHIAALLAELLDLRALTTGHILLFSLLAAVPEEMLFRGAVQPELGLLITAVSFGALHALTPLYFVYATLAGLLLGLLFDLSGALWLPVGAHFAIDAVMFSLLKQGRWPTG